MKHYEKLIEEQDYCKGAPFTGPSKKPLISCLGGWSLTILQVKSLDVAPGLARLLLQLWSMLDVLPNYGQRWPMVVKSTFNSQKMGLVPGSLKRVALYCVQELHISEWHSIVTSQRDACAIIMLFTQLFDNPANWMVIEVFTYPDFDNLSQRIFTNCTDVTPSALWRSNWAKEKQIEAVRALWEFPQHSLCKPVPALTISFVIKASFKPALKPDSCRLCLPD